MADFYSFRHICSVMNLFCTEVVCGVQINPDLFLTDCSNEFSSKLIQSELKPAFSWLSHAHLCKVIFCIVACERMLRYFYIFSLVVNLMTLNELENFVHFKHGSLWKEMVHYWYKWLYSSWLVTFLIYISKLFVLNFKRFLGLQILKLWLWCYFSYLWVKLWCTWILVRVIELDLVKILKVLSG